MFLWWLRSERIDSNSAGIDFDGKGVYFEYNNDDLVPDCEYKRAPGKDDFN